MSRFCAIGNALSGTISQELLRLYKYRRIVSLQMLSGNENNKEPGASVCGNESEVGTGGSF